MSNKKGTMWFEYHCLEDHQSSDAHLWYRSHQQIEVIGIDECEPEFLKMTEQERYEDGCMLVYRVRFNDGFIGTAWEDELLSNPSEYVRPDPPIAAKQS